MQQQLAKGEYRRLRDYLKNEINGNKALIDDGSDHASDLILLQVCFYSHLYNKNLKKSLAALNKYKSVTDLALQDYLFKEAESSLPLLHYHFDGSTKEIYGLSEKVRIYSECMKVNVDLFKQLLVVAMRLDTNMDGGYWKKD
jgi:hypothetical protein